jgi:polyisoprenoid-binding protein YceI
LGGLTIKKVTRSPGPSTPIGAATRSVGNERSVLGATGRINPDDWGVTWNMVLDAGGLVVSKEITIEVDVEAVKSPA